VQELGRVANEVDGGRVGDWNESTGWLTSVRYSMPNSGNKPGKIPTKVLCSQTEP